MAARSVVPGAADNGRASRSRQAGRRSRLRGGPARGRTAAMSRAWRWVAAVVVVAIGGPALAGLWLLSSAMPATGRHEVEGLNAPVSLFRDRWGVPPIFAEPDEDASFALGWAHAEERLWQMETMRRLGAGRLADIRGRAARSSGRWMRTLVFYR